MYPFFLSSRMGFIVVYITCKDQAEAMSISKALVEERIAACTNVFPIESLFEWESKLEKESEVVCLAKTTSHNWDKLQDRVIELHSYTTPCILKFEVEANKSYEKWIHDSVE